ncbi:14233_t:CDS:2, partial [Funneliformis geosporum]
IDLADNVKGPPTGRDQIVADRLDETPKQSENAIVKLRVVEGL